MDVVLVVAFLVENFTNLGTDAFELVGDDHVVRLDDNVKACKHAAGHRDTFNLFLNQFEFVVEKAFIILLFDHEVDAAFFGRTLIYVAQVVMKSSFLEIELFKICNGDALEAFEDVASAEDTGHSEFFLETIVVVRLVVNDNRQSVVGGSDHPLITKMLNVCVDDLSIFLH